eukprot:630947-Prymnesium_polylepis.1
MTSPRLRPLSSSHRPRRRACRLRTLLRGWPCFEREHWMASLALQPRVPLHARSLARVRSLATAGTMRTTCQMA